jgi:chaperonin GroES
MNLVPVGDRMILEKQEVVEKTASGIIVPDSAKDKSMQGKVVAIGTEVKNKDVKVGDMVLYAEYGPSNYKLGKQEYLIAKEEDILAIVR